MVKNAKKNALFEDVVLNKKCLEWSITYDSEVLSDPEWRKSNFVEKNGKNIEATSDFKKGNGLALMVYNFCC